MVLKAARTIRRTKARRVRLRLIMGKFAVNTFDLKLFISALQFVADNDHILPVAWKN